MACDEFHVHLRLKLLNEFARGIVQTGEVGTETLSDAGLNGMMHCD